MVGFVHLVEGEADERQREAVEGTGEVLWVTGCGAAQEEGECGG